MKREIEEQNRGFVVRRRECEWRAREGRKWDLEMAEVAR